MNIVESKYAAAANRRMTPERYEHTLAVAKSAMEIAGMHGVSVQDAEMAGLLHDYARDLAANELLRIAESAGLIEYEIERRVPVLLHGPVGAWLVQSELGVENRSVLRAIVVHTVGAPDMDRLAKIIYLADLIAAGRTCPIVGKLRLAVKGDLDQALLISLAFSIRYLLKRGKVIHPQTVAAWNYFLDEKGRGSLFVRGPGTGLEGGRSGCGQECR
ncbi:MAG: bis(5'-nucleosyl)-tetraphosphatase (symmetrical) YqeK [Thermacetogeniaceae bacterium]|jgi:predicted HD superfamily hydrolase involved in NAD metabolism